MLSWLRTTAGLVSFAVAILGLVASALMSVAVTLDEQERRKWRGGERGIRP